MHTDSITVKRPLLRRTLVQTIALMCASVMVLSSVSFIVAREALYKRAELHIVTLTQTAQDIIEQTLTNARSNARALAESDVRKSSLILDAKPIAGTRKELTIATKENKDGLQAFVIDVPAKDGILRVDFSVAPLLDRLQVLAGSAGNTTEILLKKKDQNGLHLIRLASPNGGATMMLGSDTLGTQDYRGVSVIAAQRTLPSLGWEVSVQLDAREALQGVFVLALFHLFLGIGLLLVAASFALWLTHTWTAPIQSLVSRVAPLGPGHWDMTTELKSEDEVALLEGVIAGMAAKLKVLYENLEQLVKQRTQELRKQYELDRAVLTTMEHAVIVTDQNGKITSMNPAAEQFVGKKLTESVGAVINDVLPLSGKAGALSKEDHPVIRAMKQRSSVHPEPGSAWSSDQRSVYLVATPLLTGSQLFGAVAVFQDVTEERKMERLKSEFITLASHQLRTPLSIVQWQMETLRDETADTETKNQSLTEVERATGRMTTITNALLQVAELEGGALTPSPKAVDLPSLMKNAIDGVIDGNAKHIKVQTTIPQTLQIETDPVLLEIVLQNLLENAIKYSPEGGNLDVQCKESSGSIAISIHDEGMGIPVSEQRHVFEKFFRGSNVKKQSTDGTGLGLYIAKMIVEELGGTISFESNEGKGTTFTVTLTHKSGA